jgi:hypothetical protein
LWRGRAWIAAVKVRITNTSDKMLQLVQFELISDPGISWTKRQNVGLIREVMRLSNAYDRSILTRTDLDAGDSTSGWLVRPVDLPHSGAGRPRCLFRMTDGVGDKYELVIPARGAQVRRVDPE